MKSDLQKRAERAAEHFGSVARRPLVIEFAGVPKAGKTTCVTHVQAFLKRCGFRTEVVVERASVCPIRDKKHANFNVWTACMTLAQILEKTQDPPRPDDPHVLLLDRGVFDAVCWMSMLERLVRIRPADREIVEKFLCVADWRKRVSAVIVLTASSEDALKREQGLLPVENTRGSIMNPEVLEQIRNTIRDCAKRLRRDFRIYEIDTSYGQTKDDPQKTAEMVADIILSLVEEHIKEEVLVLPKATIEAKFAGRACISAKEAAALAKLFAQSGEFRSRNDAENDETLVQALPIVVVRNATGSVLRLKRRERFEENPLHEKVVIWAGGHVRIEDKVNGDAVVQGAMRELKEELRLDVEAPDLRPIGAIYIETGSKRTCKHAAIAYEWRATTDDVAVALSTAEFFERRGTSLSGSFVAMSELARDVEDDRVTEPWSVELIRECLDKGSHNLLPRLF